MLGYLKITLNKVSLLDSECAVQIYNMGGSRAVATKQIVSRYQDANYPQFMFTLASNHPHFCNGC